MHLLRHPWLDRLPARSVDDSGLALAFLDVNPATEGRTLVVPRNHPEDIWELTSVIQPRYGN